MAKNWPHLDTEFGAKSHLKIKSITSQYTSTNIEIGQKLAASGHRIWCEVTFIIIISPKIWIWISQYVANNPGVVYQSLVMHGSIFVQHHFWLFWVLPIAGCCYWLVPCYFCQCLILTRSSIKCFNLNLLLGFNIIFLVDILVQYGAELPIVMWSRQYRPDRWMCFVSHGCTEWR